LVSIRDSREKRGFTPVTQTAEQPGQTVNVDLCFVPATRTSHEAKLPAVSGSSGRLVVERPALKRAERQYPGRVFDDPQYSYSEAMHVFVAASTPLALPVDPAAPAVLDEAAARQAEQRTLRQEAARLREQRRSIRQQRQQEDVAWELAAQRHKRSKPAGCPHSQRASDLHWQVLRLRRRLMLIRRRREDAMWRAARQQLRERLAQPPSVTAWVAVLVISDNCTRQCLGLPLFVAGPKVTAEVVVDALRALVPPELQFLISDRGTHFTAQIFAQFACEADFVHVLIARHRPQSNGIAERFVRTLKEWLANKIWQSASELEALLMQFRAEYNDRPHQGLAIPGLSPNEFAGRIWLM
jgi:transposase InsO family protein